MTCGPSTLQIALELLTASAEEVRSLGAVVHPQELVGRAQVLLYCGLREEEALAYLGIGEPLGHVPEDLAATVWRSWSGVIPAWTKPEAFALRASRSKTLAAWTFALSTSSWVSTSR